MIATAFEDDMPALAETLSQLTLKQLAELRLLLKTNYRIELVMEVV